MSEKSETESTDLTGVAASEATTATPKVDGDDDDVVNIDADIKNADWPKRTDDTKNMPRPKRDGEQTPSGNGSPSF